MATAKNVSMDAELDATKKAAREALEKLLEARDHFKEAAKAAGIDAQEEATDLYEQGRAGVEQVGLDVVQFVYEKPWHALGIAVVGGFVISRLISK